MSFSMWLKDLKTHDDNGCNYLWLYQTWFKSDMSILWPHSYILEIFYKTTSNLGFGEMALHLRTCSTLEESGSLLLVLILFCSETPELLATKVLALSFFLLSQLYFHIHISTQIYMHTHSKNRKNKCLKMNILILSYLGILFNLWYDLFHWNVSEDVLGCIYA